MLGFGTHLCGSFPLMMSVHLEASSVFLFQRRGIETYLLKTVKDFLSLNNKFQSEGGRLFTWMWTGICKKGECNLPKKNIGYGHILSMLLYQITNVTQEMLIIIYMCDVTQEILIITYIYKLILIVNLLAIDYKVT